MLQVTTSEDSTCAKLLGLTGNKSEGGLISKITSLLATPEGEGYDFCSFYSGPSDDAILSFVQSSEYIDFTGYSDSESCGSIAYSSGSESCGSIASSSGGSISCGGGCNYAC